VASQQVHDFPKPAHSASSRAADDKGHAMSNELLMTTAEVSQHIQIELRTVTRWLRTGCLRGRKVGRYWRIAPDDLESFLESHANRPCEDGAAALVRNGRAEKVDPSDAMADKENRPLQIRPFEFQPIKDASYLKVHTYPRPTDRTVRLGLIEWVEHGYTTYKRLVNRKPMSHHDAMEYAKRFAEKFEVPVIYQREDDPVN
jgi:excisionase family DNA binding protein